MGVDSSSLNPRPVLSREIGNLNVVSRSKLKSGSVSTSLVSSLPSLGVHFFYPSPGDNNITVGQDGTNLFLETQHTEMQADASGDEQLGNLLRYKLST